MARQSHPRTTTPANGTIRTIKLVVVGDGTVGKTCLLISYTTGSFPKGEYVPTVFENYADTVDCDGTPVNLTLWDTAGQEDYERLRPLSYPGADIFLLCFSIDNINSYHNIVSKWHPEIKHHCPTKPYLLVGTKTDLRPTSEMNQLNLENQGTIRNLAKEYVSKSMGKKLAKKIKAAKYLECSAKNLTGLNEIFLEAVCEVVTPRTKSYCNLL